MKLAIVNAPEYFTSGYQNMKKYYVCVVPILMKLYIIANFADLIPFGGGWGHRKAFKEIKLNIF